MGYEDIPTKETFREFSERRWNYESMVETAGFDLDLGSYHELVDEAIENHLPYLVENGFVDSQLFHEVLKTATAWKNSSKNFQRSALTTGTCLTETFSLKVSM